jgi:hypothetical protein
MSLKFYLIMSFLILINVVSSALNFHEYLLSSDAKNMVFGFVSATIAILLIIQFGKEL